jgi:hypothetical protein
VFGLDKKKLKKKKNVMIMKFRSAVDVFLNGELKMYRHFFYCYYYFFFIKVGHQLPKDLSIKENI